MKRWALFVATLLFTAVFLVTMTQAAEEVAGRAVYHTQKMEQIEVGDVPGHIVGVGQHSGLAFRTKGPYSGEVATRINTLYFDSVNGKGTFTAYAGHTYQEGSTQSYKASGTIMPVDGGKRSVFEGTYEVIGGTGRFEGVKGKGTFKGERIGSGKTGADSYVDWTGTEWK
jgi:hypothetical protein